LREHLEAADKLQALPQAAVRRLLGPWEQAENVSLESLPDRLVASVAQVFPDKISDGCCEPLGKLNEAAWKEERQGALVAAARLSGEDDWSGLPPLPGAEVAARGAERQSDDRANSVIEMLGLPSVHGLNSSAVTFTATEVAVPHLRTDSTGGASPDRSEASEGASVAGAASPSASVGKAIEQWLLPPSTIADLASSAPQPQAAPRPGAAAPASDSSSGALAVGTEPAAATSTGSSPSTHESFFRLRFGFGPAELFTILGERERSTLELLRGALGELEPEELEALYASCGVDERLLLQALEGRR
jgi:hypothetical protein